MRLSSLSPFALAAGLGINGIVAFTLTGKGLDAAGAMGVIVIEGVLILVLVYLIFGGTHKDSESNAAISASLFFTCTSPTCPRR